MAKTAQHKYVGWAPTWDYAGVMSCQSRAACGLAIPADRGHIRWAKVTCKKCLKKRPETKRA